MEILRFLFILKAYYNDNNLKVLYRNKIYFKNKSFIAI
jgi:hypothetical protein